MEVEKIFKMGKHSQKKLKFWRVQTESSFHADYLMVLNQTLIKKLWRHEGLMLRLKHSGSRKEYLKIGNIISFNFIVALL